MKLSEELLARGFVGQYSSETIAELFDGEKRVVYHGIDPTADSAHAGNFVNWLLLRHLVAHGHTVIFLVGGGTGMIGDPKPDQERTLVDEEEVARRVEKIRAQAMYLLGSSDIQFVNNHDWLGSLTLIGFLRDIGKHFTVNELIKKDAIARRLEGEVGLSYTEFAYPLLQAYDYLMLFRTYGCTLQVGGSDQWGNIIAGVDLVRRMEKSAVHAFTVPLIVDKVTGKKFGKSEGNAVWLDPVKTSPYTFYQFWLNTSDESVIEYLKLFTLIPLTEIATLAGELEKNPGARVAQRALARAVTAFVHGEATALAVERVSECLFGDVPIDQLAEEERALLRENAPLLSVLEGELLVDVLVRASLATSKREARMFIESGAVTLDEERVNDQTAKIIRKEGGELYKLRRGKKHTCLIEVG